MKNKEKDKEKIGREIEAAYEILRGVAAEALEEAALIYMSEVEKRLKDMGFKNTKNITRKAYASNGKYVEFFFLKDKKADKDQLLFTGGITIGSNGRIEISISTLDCPNPTPVPL